MRMDLPALTTLLTTLRLSVAVQGTPMEAFRGNVAAIHARDRAAYLSHYLHTRELARVGPDGLRQGYDDFAAARATAGRTRWLRRTCASFRSRRMSPTA